MCLFLVERCGTRQCKEESVHADAGGCAQSTPMGIGPKAKPHAPVPIGVGPSLAPATPPDHVASPDARTPAPIRRRRQHHGETAATRRYEQAGPSHSQNPMHQFAGGAARRPRGVSRGKNPMHLYAAPPGHLTLGHAARSAFVSGSKNPMHQFASPPAHCRLPHGARPPGFSGRKHCQHRRSHPKRPDRTHHKARHS